MNGIYFVSVKENVGKQRGLYPKSLKEKSIRKMINEDPKTHPHLKPVNTQKTNNNTFPCIARIN